MMITRQDPKLRRALLWGDVRKRKLGMWAYALNRLTGIGLVVYLYLHLVILSQLAQGPAGWDAFVALAKTAPFLALDVILLVGLLIHGLNGVRVGLTGFGVGVHLQKQLFITLMAVAAVAAVVGAVRIFSQ